MMLRRLKFIYALYNFFHKKQLAHNIPVYKRLGLRKRYFSSVSSKDFQAMGLNKLTDTRNEDVQATLLFNNADHVSQQSILDYDKNGFIILKEFLSNEKINAINAEVEKLVRSKKIKFGYGNKLMFAIKHSELLRSVGNDPELTEFLSTILHGNAALFQSINFIKGSEQHTHSDSIHMTTFPLGGLLGVWIALEDIDDDNGPLHYYPGSHKLPYYLNADYDNEGSYLMLGKKDYTEYEKMLEQKIKELGIEKKVFKAKKGDVLIWHANLLHGGEPHLNKEKTRKSMVLHYFDTNCVCYHEITQRPALIG